MTSPLLPLTHAGRVQRFGRFRFTTNPTPTNPEAVRILDGWAEVNLKGVWVPQLARRVTLHVKAIPSFLELWATWERLGFLGDGFESGDESCLVRTYNGAWVGRFKRQRGTWNERVAKCRTLGSASLSNHAWGTAFDINAPWNGLGRNPAAAGSAGSVRLLVPAAEALGWFWGGHFRTRPDGMHFEYVGEPRPARAPKPSRSPAGLAISVPGAVPEQPRTGQASEIARTTPAEAAAECLKPGPLSRARVRELQAAMGGLVVDGIRGPRTKARARELLGARG